MTDPADHVPPIAFRPLTEADLEPLTDWLNVPHVAQWWSEPPADSGVRPSPVTLEQTVAEYGPDLEAGGPGHEFVIVIDATPAGMIQWYRLADYPEYAAAIGEEAGDAAGVDVLIADPTLVGRGLGSRVIAQFVTEVLFATSGVDRVVAGPAVGNARSIGAFSRAGSRWVRDAAVPGEAAAEHVMVCPRGGPSR